MRTMMLAVVFVAVAAGLAAAPAHAQKKTLVVGAAVADAGKLDPHQAAAGADKGVLNWVFNALVRIKPGKASPEFIEPDLAESWTSSPDGKEWTFKIRSGVQCHGNYGPFTAEDAAYSLRRAADKSVSAFFGDFSAFDTVEAVDPATLRIRLKTPLPSLLGLVSNYHGGLMVCKKAVEEMGDGFAKRPVGTGPFSFVEYKPQQYVKLTAHKLYFRGAPQLEEILYRYIPSDATRDLAFRSGEVDMVFGRQNDQWVQRMRQGGATVVAMEPAELNMLHLNTTVKPLDDLRVRQAIAHAVNRKMLIQFQGADAARDAISVIPNGNLGIARDLQLPDYDPAKAKRLLAEAGYPNGLTVKAIQSSLPSIFRLMENVQAQLRWADIDLQIEPVDHPTYMAQIRKDLSQVTFYQAARFPVADVYLSQFFHSRSTVGTPTGIINLSHCSAADAEIDQARVEPVAEKQAALWRQAQQKILDNLCAVPLSESLVLWAWKAELDFGTEMTGSLNLVPHVTEKTRFTK